jgi:hypothetical protein
MADHLRRLSTVLCVLALSSAAGCGDDDGPGGVVIPADSGYSCVDEDNDGFTVGEGCFNLDCDDGNPDITDQCRECLDEPIQEGCACEPQEGLQCVPDPMPHPEGLLVCREGTRFCRDGLWTACEPLGEYVLVRN